MMQTGTVILASQSTTRAALLQAAGILFEARPARVDEAAVKASGLADGAAPEDVAMALAGLKASRIRTPGAIVIGADQLLVCEEQWFDKPADMATAREQLLALRGRTHDLVTAITCHRDGTEVWRHLARSRLTMRHFSEPFLDAYLAAEGPTVLDSSAPTAWKASGPSCSNGWKGNTPPCWASRCSPCSATSAAPAS